MLKSATESKLAKILGALSNEDAIKIFRFARSGFSTRNGHKRLGLSVKRYYYRLERLMDAGLVTKTNDRYQLTALGTIVCDSMERRVRWAIENIDQVQLVHTLKSSKTINDEMLKRVAADLLGSELADLELGISGRVFQTYEELVDATVRLTERAVENICLATRYMDIRAAEAGWRAARRGVSMKVIDGAVGHFSGRMKLVEMVVGNPKSIKMMYDLWHNDKVETRYRRIPFSFMIVDNRDCCFEILNPAIKSFFAAVEFGNNRVICKRMIKTFDNLWKKGARQDPFVGLTEDLMKGVGKQ